MHRISGIVLAAGGSTRMGRTKQLLQVRGAALVCHAVRAAQEGGCDCVCVVTGHAQEEVQRAVSPLEPLLVYNEHWERGMGTSIRLGLRTIQPASAIILLTCDQPAVTSSIVRSLIETHLQTMLPIVASRYADTLGIPALFAASCFAELNALPDEHGAKTLIHGDPTRVASIDFPAGALDLDTPQDMKAWQASADPVGQAASMVQ
ncbi:NTP transferase domain-containing protein [Prosthecobacter sp.]|uniref:nucleotidyltransferase family protein n=1 Tax=Prosthecobacter sp. TaxID=1965333 RepID=UPI0037831DFB